jgi:hypothetical protein
LQLDCLPYELVDRRFRYRGSLRSFMDDGAEIAEPDFISRLPQSEGRRWLLLAWRLELSRLARESCSGRVEVRNQVRILAIATRVLKALKDFQSLTIRWVAERDAIVSEIEDKCGEIWALGGGVTPQSPTDADQARKVAHELVESWEERPVIQHTTTLYEMWRKKKAAERIDTFTSVARLRQQSIVEPPRWEPAPKAWQSSPPVSAGRFPSDSPLAGIRRPNSALSRGSHASGSTASTGLEPLMRELGLEDLTGDSISVDGGTCE